MTSISAGQLAGLLAIVGSMLVGLVAVVGGLLHARRGRLLAHEERMKALELGRGLPEDEARVRAQAGEGKSMAARCFETTGWVAGCGFLFAMGSSSVAEKDRPNQAVAVAIAVSAGVVGVAGLICGTVLAAKATDAGPAPIKPRFDPEGL